MNIINNIQNKIFEIREDRVMLDKDLADKRKLKRFPQDFMFQLTQEEYDSLRFHFETLKKGRGRHSKYMPYAFTEQGVAMLSGILNSDKAINMNIAIMRAFVEVRKILLQKTDIKVQLNEIRNRLGEHDIQLSQIYDAMENLLDEKVAEQKWNERQIIGFKK